MPQAYNGAEPYIFVSYAHKDAYDVAPIIDALQTEGYRIWFDEGIEEGHEWANYIASHEKRCTAFLAFISRNSVASENCLDEIAYAKVYRKPSILCFLEDGLELPDGLEMQTGRFQRLFRSRFDSQEAMVRHLEKNGLLAPCRAMPVMASVHQPTTEEFIQKKDIADLVELAFAEQESRAQEPEEICWGDILSEEPPADTQSALPGIKLSPSDEFESWLADEVDDSSDTVTGFWNGFYSNIRKDGFAAFFGIMLELSYGIIGAVSFKMIVAYTDKGWLQFLLMLIPHIVIAIIISVVYGVRDCSNETMLTTLLCCFLSSFLAVLIGCIITPMQIGSFWEFLLCLGLNLIPLAAALLCEILLPDEICFM